MNHQKLEPLPPELPERVHSARRVLVLTGVGMPAESGAPTFHDELAGLWIRYSPEATTTEEGWHTDPELVWAWYPRRIGIVNSTSPNVGHEALARWTGLIDEEFSLQRLDIVTQNIDDLHEWAGLVVFTHLYGRLDCFHCIDCGLPGQPDLSMVSREPVLCITLSPCDSCGNDLRSGIVLFGEPLDGTDIDVSVEVAQQADLILVVGISSIVYPAAALPGLAARAGSFMAEINPDPTSLDCDLH